MGFKFEIVVFSMLRNGLQSQKCHFMHPHIILWGLSFLFGWMLESDLCRIFQYAVWLRCFFALSVSLWFIFGRAKSFCSCCCSNKALWKHAHLLKRTSKTVCVLVWRGFWWFSVLQFGLLENCWWECLFEIGNLIKMRSRVEERRSMGKAGHDTDYGGESQSSRRRVQCLSNALF